MNKPDAVTELTELARAAACGLMKGGHLDCLEDGRGVLLLRWDVLDAAARAGIDLNRKQEGSG